MPDLRVTRLTVEVMDSADPQGRYTRAELEAVVGATPAGRYTRAALEIVIEPPDTLTGRYTRAQLEAAAAGTPAGRYTRAEIEAAVAGTAAGRYTRAALEAVVLEAAPTYPTMLPGGAVGVFYDELTQSIDIDVDEEQQMLRTDDGLASAVTWSLYTDKRATASELEEAGFKPWENRGWAGDSNPEVDGDEWGSLLWLLERALRNDETLGRAERYAQDALAWMVEYGVARSTDVAARWIENTGYLELDISIRRADGRVFRRVWNATTGQAVELS